MKKGAIIAVIVVIIAGGAWFLMKGSSKQIVNADPIDTVTGFYGEWLKAAQSATAKPSKSDLAASPVLSKALRSQLASAIEAASPAMDPVLCQSQVPADITTRSLSQTEDKVRVIVEPKEKSVNQVALVTLEKRDGNWSISEITCSNGDVAPAQGEFSFEKQGFLIQKSVPKPYNPKNWHLVFSDNGKEGNVVPLIFSSKSECVAADGTKSTCNTAKFSEATQVSVHGQMTEAGVQVVRMEFGK